LLIVGRPVDRLQHRRYRLQPGEWGLPKQLFIDYRRLSMKDGIGEMDIDLETAEEWAKWFASLGDPNRILILRLLASAQQPMSVGDITANLDIGQSTVSHHLAKLADVRFVLTQRSGTSTLWRINDRCLDLFPRAADAVMGRPISNQLDQCTKHQEQQGAK
jgi:DNA-binding transcriptional ArsR family regulator